jgi:hypothetical protein
VANYAAIGGGYSNYAAGIASTIAGGYDCETEAHGAAIGGGHENLVTEQYGHISGGYRARSDHYGEAAQASGAFSQPGDAQTSVLTARAVTTDTTEVEMFLDGSSQRMTLEDGDAWAYCVRLITREVDHQQRSGHREFKGVISRVGSSTTLQGRMTGTWGRQLGNVAVEAVDNALVIKVTGVRDTTVRWVARVELVRVNAQ